MTHRDGQVTVNNLAPTTCRTASGDQPNFMPVGLGILVARNYLTDVHVLDCPSMRSGATTYYDSPEPNTALQINQYDYDPNVWKKIVGTPALGAPEQMFLIGDGTQLLQTPQTPAGGQPAATLAWSGSFPASPTAIRRSIMIRISPIAGGTDPSGLDDGSGNGSPRHSASCRWTPWRQAGPLSRYFPSS